MLRSMLAVLPFLLPLPAWAAPINCVVEPAAVVDLAAADQGRIEEIMVSRGDRVRVGDVLVRLEDRIERLQLEAARARAASDVETRAGETLLELRQRELDRVTQLQERDVGASSAVEDAEVGLALAQLDAERAATTRELARIEVRQAQALLDRRTVRSPVDAVVVAIAASTGEYLSDQAPIMTLAVVDPLHVEVFVPPELYGRITPGERYMVSQAAPLTGRFEAEVTVVDPIFDAASGTFGVRLELANPDGVVPAGTRCLVDFDAR